MINLEHLNTQSREILNEEFPDIKILGSWQTDEIALILIANFLREISDTLARIDEKLGGIEMNTRPSP